MEDNSKNMTAKTVITNSAIETENLGEMVGRYLKGGEVIVLASDLGGGKTTFVRGLARGAGSADHVSSPTFTLSKVYQVQPDNGAKASIDSDNKSLREIQHFDFYRLDEAGIMSNELAELVGDPEIAVVVEWSDIVADVLPEERLTVRLVVDAESESERRIEFTYPTSLAYLVGGIK